MIMTCPRCGGCGETIQGNEGTTAGPYKTVCLSCNGSGYVSDTSSFTSPPTSVVVNIDSLKCPECGKAIKIWLGHYLVLPDTAKRI